MPRASSLLFVFAAERLKVRPSELTLEQLDAGLVSAFLEHLEDARKNAAVTRNVRLAAIKSSSSLPSNTGSRQLWSRSAASWPSHSRKRTNAWCLILLKDELQAVLDAPDPAMRDGIRDRGDTASGGLRWSARVRADRP